MGLNARDLPCLVEEPSLGKNLIFQDKLWGVLFSWGVMWIWDKDKPILSTDFKRFCGIISHIMRKELEGTVFNTFSFMYDFLSNIRDGKEGDLNYLLSVLKALEYDSCRLMDKDKMWNCVDFALSLKRKLMSKWLELNIVWVKPKNEKYSELQKTFMKVRHVALAYRDASGAIALYEPSRKHTSPIILNPGYLSWGEDFVFQTTVEWENTFKQEIALRENPSLIIDSRFIMKEEIQDEDCQELTKKLTRIPRKLEIVVKTDWKKATFLSFKPESNWLLQINDNGIISTMRASDISFEENRRLSELFCMEDLKGKLEYLLKKYYNLSPSFWIR